MSYYFVSYVMIYPMLILVIIFVLLSVAFLTLMERKILGYIQLRKGPNKIFIQGVMQPFSDALKLIFKEFFFVKVANYLFYYFVPAYMMILIMMMWMIYPFWSNLMSMEKGILYLVCCFSVGVYGLMFVGWGANSMYSMLGSVRSLGQSISYEVILALIFLSVIFITESFSFFIYFKFPLKLNMFLFLLPLSIVFFFSLMAELNRTPFDFSEGESELVSGFNIEYMSSGFILIFLSEYASIIFLGYIYTLMFLGGSIMSLMFYFKLIFIIFLIVWVRGTFPRFRYDLLMYMCWLILLPFVLNYIYLIVILKILLYKGKMMEF